MPGFDYVFLAVEYCFLLMKRGKKAEKPSTTDCFRTSVDCFLDSKHCVKPMAEAVEVRDSLRFFYINKDICISDYCLSLGRQQEDY